MKTKVHSAVVRGIVLLFLVTECHCGLLGLGLACWLVSKSQAPLSWCGVDWVHNSLESKAFPFRVLTLYLFQPALDVWAKLTLLYSVAYHLGFEKEVMIDDIGVLCFLCHLNDLYVTGMFSLIHIQTFKEKVRKSEGITSLWYLIWVREYIIQNRVLSVCILKSALSHGTNNRYSELASEIVQC